MADEKMLKLVLLKTFNILLVLFALSFVFIKGNAEGPQGYMRREFSLVRPFGAAGSLQYWEIIGSTIATDEHIRLTPDHQSKQGAIWNIMPSFVKNWEIHLNFKVHGQGTRLFGDGFSFWYTKHRGRLGPVFGNEDYFSGLGIFFDTYSNHNGEHAHEHPYISAQVNNGSAHYDHDRDGTHSEVAGCTSYFRGVESDTKVAIRYFTSKKRLTLQVNVDGDENWKDCFDVEGVELPTGYYFGLSAATGDLADNHDIIGMKFYELESNEKEDTEKDYTDIVPRAEHAAPYRDHVEDPKGSFSPRVKKAFSWLFIIGLIITVIILAGVYIYHKKQQESSKRFY